MRSGNSMYVHWVGNVGRSNEGGGGARGRECSGRVAGKEGIGRKTGDYTPSCINTGHL